MLIDTVSRDSPRETRRLSCGRDDGVAAALSREDAIDVIAVSLTRRDGPERSETAQNQKRNHPRPPLLETTRVDGVKRDAESAQVIKTA